MTLDDLDIVITHAWAMLRARLDDQTAQLASLQVLVRELSQERDDLKAHLEALQLDSHATAMRMHAIETEQARSSES
jgi:cell division protein FtsB